MPFTGNIAGLKALMARLDTAMALLGPGVAQAIFLAADDAVLLTHEASPVDDDEDNGVIPGEEGHLNESFFADPVQETSVGATTTVRTTEPIKYGYVTLGTKDKEMIYPVTRGALYWPALGHPIGMVHGQEPNDFTAPIGDEVASKGEEYFAPLMDALIRIL